eukprot:GGOE01031275.1.p3 GENE.GGOE01031275.1~~GGOE01031275.1.p3  ORF type:complete len:141 (-),score=9.99 GGOE01031275.1:426-848(-)
MASDVFITTLLPSASHATPCLTRPSQPVGERQPMPLCNSPSPSLPFPPRWSSMLENLLSVQGSATPATRKLLSCSLALAWWSLLQCFEDWHQGDLRVCQMFAHTPNVLFPFAFTTLSPGDHHTANFAAEPEIQPCFTAHG